MSRNELKSLTLLEGLYKEMEKYFEQSNGYSVSISEIIREAVRDY